MRKQPNSRAVALAVLVVATVAGAQAGFSHTALLSTERSTPSTRSVTYLGIAVTVPSDWPVTDLASDPGQCVRFDAPAVYLAHAGPDPRCPSRLIGRSDGLQIEPVDALSAERAAKATVAGTLNGVPVQLDPTAAADGEVRVVVPRLAVLVTASRRATGSVIDQVLNSLQAAPGSTGAAPRAAATKASPAAPASQAAVRGPTTFTGEGFDTCGAPSESTMASWLASPYRSIGIYIGGTNRACSQPNLTSQWVVDETNLGWRLAPIWVGLQAPCNSGLGLAGIDPQQADPQGRAAADNAVSASAGLGLASGTPIYDDMEGYDTTKAGCSQAVLAFLNGWTAELHARGYASGVYGSSSSTVSDLVSRYNAAGFNTPDDIWFASWSCCPHSVDGDPRIPAGDWSPHRRLHQYQGGHDETWGGVVINIDSNFDDGLLAGAIPGYVLDGWGGIHPFGGAQPLTGNSYWPGKDVTRGIGLQPSGAGGYVLDDWGGVHPFGSAPAVVATSYWPGQDVARALAMNPCDTTGTSGYVLDWWGGLHPFGGAPAIGVTGYWPGHDIARALTMICLAGRPSGQVLDGWGGLHPVGTAPVISGEAYWPGQDIVVGAALTGPGSGYTLDSWGGIHPFGGAAAVTPSAYYPSTHIARAIALTRGLAGGYVLDAFGGVHWFGNAASQNLSTFSTPLARGVVVGA